MSNDLPKGWSCTYLENVVEILDRKRVPLNNRERQKRIEGKNIDELFPYYGATGQVGYIDDFIFDDELVLLGEDGAPFFDYSRNKAYIINGKTWVNNHAHVLKAIDKVITNQFLYNFLNLFDYHGFVTGTTRLKLNQSQMRKIPISIPPLNEQKRIVNKIEELFTKLDAGIQELTLAKEKLKIYRQSVLKHAFEGKLTEEWREDHKDEVEHPSILLQNIEETRKRILKKKYSFNEINKDELSSIPESWAWTRLENICDMTSGRAFKKSEYSEEGVKLLQIANVTFGKIIWDKLAYLPEDYLKKYPKLALNVGDILMALNRPLLSGKLKIGQLKESDFPAILYQRVGRFDFYDDSLKMYFYHFLNSPMFINKLKDDLQGVDQPFVNKPKLLNNLIPIPPLEEQKQIIEEIEKRTSVIDEIEKNIDLNFLQSKKLRQSILKKAFTGQIVPQDPNDEPAEQLLQRIKAQKEKQKPQRKSKQKRLVK